jgi:hypothetical protein
MVDGDVVKDLVTKEVQTSMGVLQVVMGYTLLGVRKTRSVRIPASTPIYIAQEICRLRGGQFSPATPSDPKKQLLSETWGIKCLKPQVQKEIYLSLIADFDPEVSKQEDLEFYKEELSKLEL